MKKTVKAIMFKSNGNEIKTTSIDVIQWVDRVYYAIDKDCENLARLFLEVNGIYGEIEHLSTWQIKDENIPKLQPILNDFEAWLLSLRWINLAHLELAKQAGLNYDKLLQRRNEIKSEREEKEKQQQAEKLQQKQEALLEYAANMAEIKEKLKSGSVLSMSKVIECYQHFGFKVHPRTLGTMYKVDGVISINSATKAKGMSWNTHSSIIQTVKDFINHNDQSNR